MRQQNGLEETDGPVMLQVPLLAKKPNHITASESFKLPQRESLTAMTAAAELHVTLTSLQERRAAGHISIATVYAQNVTSDIRSTNDANEGL